MNAYMPRLAAHGIETEDALIDMTPDALWESAKEALMAARKLGKKVVYGGKVYGTVDILNPIDPDNPLKHLLTVKNIFYTLKMQNNKFTKKKQHDYNFNIDGLLFIK